MSHVEPETAGVPMQCTHCMGYLANPVSPMKKDNPSFLLPPPFIFLIFFKKTGAFPDTCSLFIILHFPIQSLLPMRRTGKNPPNKGALEVYGF